MDNFSFWYCDKNDWNIFALMLSLADVSMPVLLETMLAAAMASQIFFRVFSRSRSPTVFRVSDTER